MSQNMLTEILTTLLVFLSSANREIVKSTLGFIKLAIHTLPIELLQPHLPQLVPALLNWSHDHKNHFKLKVRHIFERILRRFPWDAVYSCAGDMEAAKVLVNIRKSKERAKKKKAAKAMEVEEDEVRPDYMTSSTSLIEFCRMKSPRRLQAMPSKMCFTEAKAKRKMTTMSMFPSRLPKQREIERTLPKIYVSKWMTTSHWTFCMERQPNSPVRVGTFRHTDFHLSSDQSSKGRRRAGADASRFGVDEGTGKMVIDEEEEEEIDQEAYEIEGNAYKETLTSVDGFTRGPNGRVKFNKDTKKRRREEEQMEDVEMGDAEQVSAAKSKKAKKQEPRLGHEFKAKVRPFSIAFPIVADILSRRLVAISRRKGSILTRISLCQRLQRVRERSLVLRARDNLRLLCIVHHPLKTSSIHKVLGHEAFQRDHVSRNQVLSTAMMPRRDPSHERLQTLVDVHPTCCPPLLHIAQALQSVSPNLLAEK